MEVDNNEVNFDGNFKPQSRSPVEENNNVKDIPFEDVKTSKKCFKIQP